MEYVILAGVGILTGFFGGLLGIGGSTILIPALVFILGENQHLYQAAAMICSFFVGASAVVAHKKADVLMPSVLKWLIPAGAVGIVSGVWLSNTAIFAGDKSYILARAFGLFIVFVIIHNLLRLD